MERNKMTRYQKKTTKNRIEIQRNADENGNEQKKTCIKYMWKNNMPKKPKSKKKNKRQKKWMSKIKIIPLKNSFIRWTWFLSDSLHLLIARIKYLNRQSDKNVRRNGTIYVIDQLKRRRQKKWVKCNPFDEFSADVTLNELLMKNSEKRSAEESHKTAQKPTHQWIALDSS